MPPTYPGECRYLVEERVFDDSTHRTVLHDSYQSQANRVEEALLAAHDAGVLGWRALNR